MHKPPSDSRGTSQMVYGDPREVHQDEAAVRRTQKRSVLPLCWVQLDPYTMLQ